MLRIGWIVCIPTFVFALACDDTPTSEWRSQNDGLGHDDDNEHAHGDEADEHACGNGQVNPGEDCDDDNDNDNDSCLSDCTEASCGDGFVGPGEACDDGNDDDNDSCLSDCTEASCGDGFVGPGEACDDGNDDETDGCLTTCEIETCGDGVVDPEDECDDGNGDDTDECLTSCLIATCGDGHLWVGYEECDDANVDDSDGCVDACQLAICGDGHTWVGEELCDDGNQDDTDACTIFCEPPSCEDGIVSGGELDIDCGGECPSECIPDNWYFPIVDNVDYTHVGGMFADDGGATLSADIGPNGVFAGQAWAAGTYFIHLDDTGTMTWQKKLSANIGVARLQKVPTGGFVATGSYRNQVTFGLGEPNQIVTPNLGGQNAFLAKYSDNGMLEWLTYVSETGTEWFLDAIQLSDGSYMVIGNYTLNMTLNPGAANQIVLAGPQNTTYMFVSRFKPGVGHVWAQTWLGGNYDNAVLLPDDSVIITGSHSVALVYGHGSLNPSNHPLWGGGDAFVTRISANGVRLWEGQMGGGFRTYARDIDIAPDQSAVYLTGNWSGLSSFDPLVKNQVTSLSQNNNYDTYVMRLSLDGALEWIRKAGGAGSDSGRGIAAVDNGNVVIAGNFLVSMHIGENDPDAVDFVAPGFAFLNDSFMASYSASGDFLSASQVSSQWGEQVWDMEPAGQAVLLDVGYLEATYNPVEDALTFMPGEPNQAIVFGDWADQVVARIVPGG